MNEISLQTIQNDFRSCASSLRVTDEETGRVKDYTELSKAELANGYCDAEEAGNDFLMSCYVAAILLRYWYKIFEWISTCRSLGLKPTDFVDWLIDCWYDALYYRSWRPLRKEFGKTGNYIPNPQYRPDDPDAFDKSMNNFCRMKRAKMYQASNKLKRKGNYNAISIDDSFDENGYSILDREGLSTQSKAYNGVAEIVKSFLNEDKCIEALIVDGIANQDSWKQEKEKVVETEIEVDDDGNETEVTNKYYKYKNLFDARKLVKHLVNIDADFMQHFTEEYEVKNPNVILETLKNLTNGKLYKYIDKTLIMLRENPKYLEYLTVGM